MIHVTRNKMHDTATFCQRFIVKQIARKIIFTRVFNLFIIRPNKYLNLKLKLTNIK